MDIQIRLTICVVLVSTVGVLATVLGLLWSMPDLPETISNNKMCLPVITEFGLTAELNCGQTVDKLHVYLQQSIENENAKLQKEELEKNNLQASERPIGLKQFFENNYWEMKPAARFTGTMPSDPRPSDLESDLVTIREWRHGSRLWDNGGFCRYGIKYVNGRIVVPVAGTYEVYSFLDMYEPCIEGTGIPDVKNVNQSIKHSIFKFNILDEYETELISGVQPHLNSTNLYFNIYSSFISSIVELKAGDELVVKASNITYLKYPEVNYFGVHLI